MSTLADTEKRYLEKILRMQTGYLLDYTDATFGELFARHGIDIHGDKYRNYGGSKAKKMRAFWEREPDHLLGTILSEMLDSYETECELNQRPKDSPVLERCRTIVARLTGKQPVTTASDEQIFLEKEFTVQNLHKLPVEDAVAKIVEARLAEALKALSVGANLSVILLCGSVLEGVLLGAAQRNPEKFNRAKASPKAQDGSVKSLQDWSLAQLIDAACEIQLLKLDVKKFSHGLRDFRNYIHPYEQLVSGFTPDKHTAKVCFQVLKAALASLAGDR